MKNIILACRILEDEVLAALKKTGCTAPVIWLDSSLHLYPEKLRAGLQSHIDQISNVDNILLTFGLCGKSIIGLVAPTARLVIPLVNDCIEMLTKPDITGLPQQDTKGCYFLTPGWTRSDRTLVKEVDHYYQKYGAARAQRILKAMLGNYSHLAVLDTRAYTLEAFLPEARELAGKLELDIKICQASIRLLERLFAEQWDDGFCLMPPGVPVSEDYFRKVTGTAGLVNSLSVSGGSTSARPATGQAD